jgi:hypothetical protein
MVLELSGLNLDKLIEQGNSGDPSVIRERQYDLDDGARSLTNDVAGRWGQTPYRVEFRCDGQKFFTASVITLNPAIRYQFKSGQRDWSET